jgi:hypothetical protein
VLELELHPAPRSEPPRREPALRNDRPLCQSRRNNMAIISPWLTKLIGEDRDLLGLDWWPYGIAANRKAIDAVLRYHHGQGLTKRRFRA